MCGYLKRFLTADYVTHHVMIYSSLSNLNDCVSVSVYA